MGYTQTSAQSVQVNSTGSKTSAAQGPVLPDFDNVNDTASLTNTIAYINANPAGGPYTIDTGRNTISTAALPVLVRGVPLTLNGPPERM